MSVAQPSVNGQLVQSELDELICGPQTPSLWSTLEGMLQGPAEADFVKDVVGASLLRDVEGAREELRSLLSILSDLRDSSSNNNNNTSPSSGAGGGRFTSSPNRQYTTKGSAPPESDLKPHPPPSSVLGQGVSLLQQRLKTLLETATEPAIETTFSNPREKMVAQYVMSGSQRPASGAGKRPGTRGSLASRGSSGGAGGAGGRSTSGGGLGTSIRPFSAASGGSAGTTSTASYFDPSANLQTIKAQLRFDAVHEIKDQLQELFQNEKVLLLDDIELLRSAIEEEMMWGMFSQPSHKELGDMTAKLEEKQQAEEHQRTISALPSAGSGGGSAASLLRHRSLPSLAQQASLGAEPQRVIASPPGANSSQRLRTTTAQAPASGTQLATPPKAAPLAPLRAVAAPKSASSQPRL